MTEFFLGLTVGLLLSLVLHWRHRWQMAAIEALAANAEFEVEHLRYERGARP